MLANRRQCHCVTPTAVPGSDRNKPYMRKGNIMFNMENVGMRISELRKSKNMTQMELADRMNISFQAVSNWERGNSMPDISKLPELAQIFGVTIDDILGEKSELIDSAADGKLGEYLESNEVSPKQLSDVAPILKPEQVDSAFEKTHVSSLREVADLLPFIGRDLVNRLALKAAEEGNFDDLGELVPFTDRSVLNDIARKMISEGKSIEDIAPFVSRDIISELADANYKAGGLRALDDFAPFIPRERLEKIAEEEFANRGLRYFESIAPFLNRGYLNELAKKALQ